MFWEKFLEICNARGESPNGVAKKIGVASCSVTSWKNGGRPRDSTLLKLASYFGVTADYLLGNEPTSPAAPTENVVIYHRDGKTTTKQYSQKQMDMFLKLLDVIPEEEDE